jgi:hypothetical protein
MAHVRLALLLFLAAACGEPADSTPDAGMTTADGADSDAELCMPACATEANADVECTVFATCESTCSAGFARCGDACVAETPMQCGAGCEPCPGPANGSPTCDGGVCGVTCDPGYVACSGYSGTSCCPYASELVAPIELGGYMPSLAVDADGKLHVAYYGSAEHKLMYAHETTGGLVRESARWYWSSGGGARFQLALGKRGPLIAYTYPNSRSGLFVAERRAKGWSHATLVAQSTPAGFALATDRAGRAHVCFTGTSGLSYAIRRGDRWTTTAVGDAEAKGACAIAIDRDGVPHIAYYRNATADLAYAHGSTAGTFTTTVVDTAGNVGSQVAIAVASDGTPHIAAYRSDTQDLRWAVANGASWTVQDVGPGRIGERPNITIAGNGLPVISYGRAEQYRLVLVVRTPSQTWGGGVLEDISSGAAPLATAPDGNVWLATGDRDVLVYELAGNSLSGYAIDREHKAGYDVALVHRNQQPSLVYAVTGDDNVSRVEVATRANGAWTFTQLATPGTGAVAALDPANRTHVVYKTGTALSYATDTGGNFAIETLAASASEPSLAVDAAGAPHAVYVESVATSSYALVLAVRGAAGWSTTTIGPAAAYGTYRDPVVRTSGGVVHVVWYDSIAKATHYAASSDGYAKVTLEATSAGGHDLYVSPAGVPHVCLFRRTSSSWPDLRYATRSGATWSSVVVSPPGSAVNDSICAIRGDASGTIAIARSLRYGAGLGRLVLTTLGSPNTHATLQDDFYSAGIGLSVGANGFEVAATGRPYSGSGNDQLRVRWAHK